MCFYYLQEKQCDKPINQMEQFISFIRKEWFHIIRDRKTLFILFGMPLVQIIIFGFALTNEVKNAHIAVLDLSGDQVTTRIYSELAASSNFEIVESLHSYDQIDASLKSGKVKMVVVFPCNFKQDLMHNKYVQIQLIADASDPNTATTLVNYASAIIQDFQMNYFGYTLPLVIQPQLRMLYNPQLKGEFNFVPGVMALVLMLVSTMMTSIAVVREKELGTMEILLTSPVKPILIIIAKTIPYLLLSLVNISSILLLSVFVLKLEIQGSVLLLFGLSTLFTFTCLSLGLLISSSTSSQQTAMLISLMGLFLPTIMLSGFMFPIENMPIPLQVISNIVPAKWYYYIVRSIMIKGLGLHAIWKETLILFGMTIFFLTLSIKKFKIRLG
jgi:ABC-2 type transport system permease protein